MTRHANKGFILIFQLNGRLRSVIKDDFNFFSIVPQDNFSDYFAEEDSEQVRNFFSSVKTIRSTNESRARLKVEGTFVEVALVGGPFDHGVILVGASSGETHGKEIMRNLCDQFIAFESLFSNRAEPRRESSQSIHSFESAGWEDDCRQYEEEVEVLKNKLEGKNEELKNKNKELDHFAHVVSHDLKAPLSQSKLIVHVLQKKLREEELSRDIRQLLEMLVASSSHMSSLIDTIHAYSQSGLFDHNVSTFSLRELCVETIDGIHAPEFIKFHLPASSFEVTANRHQLCQVFKQLFTNAVRHHHSKEGNIAVKFRENKNDYFFEVIDDGPGIPEEYHQNVFEIFNKANKRSDPKASGVGLSIVKKLVENAGGTIQLDSKVGRGSNFNFSWAKCRPDFAV